ncbi:MAG: class I SAM-dependent methyltransferase [Chromatiaceae bacterium]|nr:MAG: class I SAM-dependent methyltransferase [Chromatiaceae bacterium]
MERQRLTIRPSVEEGSTALKPLANPRKLWIYQKLINQPASNRPSHPTPLAVHTRQLRVSEFEYMTSPGSIMAAAQHLSLDQWIERISQAMLRPQSLGPFPLPGAPAEQVQATFVGSSGEAAIAEAGRFYKYVLAANDRFRGRAIAQFLDFGCGWGRYTRLFLRDVPQNGLYGADPNPYAIRTCREHIPYACFALTSTRPPLPFRDQYFDVVIAYSVFSHLSEINAATWIYELSRVLKPGGLLIGTTHAVWLLDLVSKLQDGSEPLSSRWHERLAASWPDVADARAQYERGEFVFPITGEYEDLDGYGDAIVPEKYVREVWGKYLEVVEYVSDLQVLPQAAFVMRKPA